MRMRRNSKGCLPTIGIDNHMDAELFAVQTGRGLWASPSVPKSGWRCVGITDLGTPSRVCDMCQVMHIRYAHTMHHQASGQTLVAGCVCAGHMQGDLACAQGNDTWLRNRAARRLRWTRRRWRTSRSGNPCTTSEGMTLTVFRQGAGWKGVVSDPDRPASRAFTDRAYLDQEEAKTAVFDLCTQYLAHHRIQYGQSTHPTTSTRPSRRITTAEAVQPGTIRPKWWERMRVAAGRLFGS
jgi:hypothetical protein